MHSFTTQRHDDLLTCKFCQRSDEAVLSFYDGTYHVRCEHLHNDDKPVGPVDDPFFPRYPGA